MNMGPYDHSCCYLLIWGKEKDARGEKEKKIAVM